MSLADLPSARAVRKLRARRGFTQERLAELAGVDRIGIINVEKGRNLATSARMRDGLAGAFGFTGERMSEILSTGVVPDEPAPTHAAPRKRRGKVDPHKGTKPREAPVPAEHARKVA